MSRKPTSPSARLPLRDLFQQEQQNTGGNPAVAFIAILDEMDHRMVDLSRSVETNREAFHEMVEWHKRVTGQLTALPEEMQGSAEKALRRLQPVLEHAVEDKARMGAETGTSAARTSVEALREARDAYETRKARLTRIATFGFPAAFGIVVTFGFAFGSWVIPALPASWQWPCWIIGAEYYVNQSDGAAFCLVYKDR